MNIIITGTKGSGKSTLANRVLDGFSGSVSGFRTVFRNRCEETQALYVESLDGSISCRAADWSDGGRRLYSEAFDCLAVSLIDSGSQLVFIDELGFMEKDSTSLKDAVEQAFDKCRNTVCVIRIDAVGWMQELKARKDVTVMAVTHENRDLLCDHILALLNT